ncbi:MAG: tetratricopeptide repeat protein [Halobacteriota archaeon]
MTERWKCPWGGLALNEEERLTIGQRLAAYRKAKKLTQLQLSEGICSHTSISHMESGLCILSEDKLQKICDKLEIKIQDLIASHRAEIDSRIAMGIVRIQMERQQYSVAIQLVEQLLSDETQLEEQVRPILIANRSECLIRMGQAEQAIGDLTELLQQLEQVKQQQDLHFMATCYDLLGKAHCMSADANIAKGYAYSLRAFQISMKFPVRDEVAAKIAFNLGKICNLMRNPVDAKEYFEIAQEYFEKVSDTMRLAWTFFEHGIAYHRLNQLDRAESYLGKSFTLYQSLNLVHKAQRVKRTITELVWSKTQPQLTIPKLLECVQMFEQLGDLPRVAYTHATIASFCLENEEISEAGKYLSLAINLISDEHQSIHEAMYAAILHVQAKYFFVIEKYEDSIESSYKSANLFDKIGMGREAADSLEIGFKTCRKLGRTDEAMDLSERIFTLLRGSHATFQFDQREGIIQ